MLRIPYVTPKQSWDAVFQAKDHYYTAFALRLALSNAADLSDRLAGKADEYLSFCHHNRSVPALLKTGAQASYTKLVAKSFFLDLAERTGPGENREQYMMTLAKELLPDELQWTTPFVRDPFEVGLQSQKSDLILGASVLPPYPCRFAQPSVVGVYQFRLRMFFQAHVLDWDRLMNNRLDA